MCGITCCGELHRHRLLILYLASQSFKELDANVQMCKSENVQMLLTTSVNVAVPNLPSDAFALTRFFLNVQICNYADAPMIFLLFLKNYYSVISFPFSDWERKGINHSLLRKMFFEDLFSPIVKPYFEQPFYHSF